MSAEDQLGPLRRLLDAHSQQQHTPSSGHAAGRPELTAAAVGSVVAMPASTPVWRHTTTSSRELVPFSYDGGELVVHNVEPAGASFLTRTSEVEVKVRRGPALTLRVPGGLRRSRRGAARRLRGRPRLGRL